MCFLITLSKTFIKWEVKLTGLYCSGFVFAPPLWIGVMLAILNISGIFPSSKLFLNKYFNGHDMVSFVLIMNSAGISRRLIAFASALVGFIKGGLSMINIATSMFFAEISGSAVADVAALGSILIPAMKKKGYPGAFAAAVTSSSASLAIIIPPSIPMIVYAVMSQSSVVQLFVAGIIPGVIGGFFLMLAAYVTARKKNFPVEETFNIPNVKKTAKDAVQRKHT